MSLCVYMFVYLSVNWYVCLYVRTCVLVECVGVFVCGGVCLSVCRDMMYSLVVV